MENADLEYAEIEILKSDAENYGVDVRPEVEFITDDNRIVACELPASGDAQPIVN